MQIGIRPEATVVIITTTIIRIHKDKIIMAITNITVTTIPEGIIIGAGITTNRIETIIIILMVTITLATVTITGVVITKAKAEVIITIIITETIIIVGIIVIESIM